jgi:hypothetical protein
MSWPSPQVIKPGMPGETDYDKLLVIDAANVIDDTTQLPIVLATIEVTVTLINMTTASEDSEDVTMQRSTDGMTYYIDLDTESALKALLLDKTKYVGSIAENGGGNMRTIRIEEFAVDYGQIDAITASKAFQYTGLGTADAKIVWYDDETFTDARFEALVYEGGSGTTPATRPERVTHRGRITVI